MNTLKYVLLAVVSFIFFISCQNNIQKFIAKKWDCAQVENLAPLDRNFTTPKDSAIAVQTEAALKALNWTFNNSNTYYCSIGDRIITQGTYEIAPDEKTLTCTSLSKNTVNTYLITSLSEIELILTSTGTAVPLILHFRPH